jgi:multicomponent Na+:H+ antiporter subunit C
MLDELAARFPYWFTGLLMAAGLYGMLSKRHLVKKLIGLNILQSAVILFYVAGSMKDGGTVPILLGGHGEGGPVHPEDYVNPLPHVLMLTAIVVSAAITGVALAFMVRIHRRYGTLDERALLEQVR